MGDKVRDQAYLPELIRMFQKHGGYWWIDQSEDNNMSIEYNPFMSIDGKMPKIFRKRVYSIKDFYNEEVVPIFNEAGCKELPWQ